MKFFERWPFAGLAIALAMLTSLCVAPETALAQPVSPKNAQGSFIVNGEKTALHHAYSLIQPAREGDQAYTILLLADKPLPDELLFERFDAKFFSPPIGTQVIEVWLDHLRRIHRIFIHLDTFFSGMDKPAYKTSFATFANDSLKGRIYVDSAQKRNDKTFTFDLRFNTVMLQPRSPDLTGKAAWASVQGKALAAYLRALHAGDKAALKRAVTASIAQKLGEPGSEVELKLMNMLSPLPAELSTFDSLKIYGDVAKANISAKIDDEHVIKNQHTLRRVGDVWLVAPSR